MTISIITPVFNGEKFIEACINSVITQNCRNIEHLIIDGGSSDCTLDIIKKYSAINSHIRFLSEKDHGQSDAMNKGIAMSKGQIIGFLNVDDYYEPGTLNRVYNIFKTLPQPSMIVGNCNVWGPGDQLLYINKPSRLTLYDFVSGRPFPVNPSAYFYHKSLHEIIGIYDVYDTHSMDLDFLLRAVQHAPVYYFDELWGNFRFIEGTKTYDDTARDVGFQRMKSLLEKYRKNLDIWQRIKSKINFSIYEMGWYTFKGLRALNIDTNFLSSLVSH